MNEFSRKIRNFFRVIKKPFLKKKDFWIDNIPEIDDENKKLINFIDQYSLTPLVRRLTLIKSVHYINKNQIEGDIVECGIWRGGNLFLVKKIQEKYYNNIKRSLYGYDTFEGYGFFQRLNKKNISDQIKKRGMIKLDELVI